MRAWIRRMWSAFRRPSTRWGAGTLVVLGLVAGAIGWGGFEAYVASTSTLPFCTSCHEMQAFVYEEYKKTPHYTNASGVRAICSDCRSSISKNRAALPGVERFDFSSAVAATMAPSGLRSSCESMARN